MLIEPHVLAGSWRRWWSYDAPRVGPAWLQLVWTAVFAAVVAVGFTILGFVMFAGGEGAWRNLPGWAEWYGRNLVVALVVAYTIHGLFSLLALGLGEVRLRRLTGWRRTLFFAGVPIAGLAIGWPLGAWLVVGNFGWFTQLGANAMAGSLLLALLVTAVFQVIWTIRSREIAARMLATEAQLKLLQAQIEPHFLFNTLANVLSLVDTDAARAKSMLEAFIDYLRSSLLQQRRDATSVGAELALARAYLLLLQARMDDRLRFEISATPEALERMIPPLLLQPLVENAIRHGLEPKIDGGTVRISASVQNRRLHLHIRDDGMGLDAPKRPGPRGAGVALDNIRARLAARYGADARLLLERQEPGTCATLDLPAP